MNNIAPLTAEAVEQFLIERLNEMQAMVPEYATLTVEISRHLYEGKLEPVRLKWTGYFGSGTFFPPCAYDESVSLERVMNHVKHIAKDRRPEVIAAKFREQAAFMLAQAEQTERNAGIQPTVLTP